MAAADRRKMLAKLKDEMRNALNAEPDRRKRKHLQKEYEGKIAALTGKAEATEECDEAPMNLDFVLLDKGVAKSELKRERQALRRQAESERIKTALADTDMSEVENAKLGARLRAEHLRIHNILSDGNCLYGAVAHQLSMHADKLVQLDHQELRREAAKGLTMWRDEYEPFLPYEWSEYLHRLQYSSEYGGELELTVLARMLGVKIKVFVAEGPLPTYGNGEVELLLSFHRHLLASCHYNSLVKEIISPHQLPE